jgi:hypothetical protein
MEGRLWLFIIKPEVGNRKPEAVYRTLQACLYHARPGVLYGFPQGSYATQNVLSGITPSVQYLMQSKLLNTNGKNVRRSFFIFTKKTEC